MKSNLLLLLAPGVLAATSWLVGAQDLKKLGPLPGDRGALAGHRHRVLVSTDIGGTDPDDFQSMVHLLLYADCLDLEGLVSSPYGPGRKEHILQVIDCYEKDFANLKTHSDKYPTPAALRAITKQGETEVAPYAGVRQATEGSKWIVQCAKRADARPLHVLVWGGLEDLAQALHDAPEILSKLRVYWVGGPNKKWSPDAYQYIAENHPKLWLIEANATYRGWFTGGNQKSPCGNKELVTRHVAGKGALGGYFASLLNGTIRMGDSPSVGWLLRGNPDDPSQRGWGGHFVRAGDRPCVRFDRLTTKEDRIEQFAIVELVLPLGEGAPQKSEARLNIENQSLVGHAPGDGTMRFRYCPKEAKAIRYTIRSNVPTLDGKAGAITAIPPDALKRPSKNYPNWWTDNPAQEFAEGQHIGAKSVNQWREDFLGDFALRFARCAMSRAAQPAQVSPHAVCGPVGIADARWTTGFWADRFEVCRSATVPSMGTLMEGNERSQFLHNFRIAAGLADGKHRGPPWNDGDYYKWIETAASVFAITKDAALDERMDQAITVIAKAQRADGYLHTPVLIANRNGDNTVKPFRDRLNFEMYNFGHLFTAAGVHHRATGKKTFLTVAEKAADFLCTAFEKPSAELASNNICPSHYMGTIELYRLTGDKKYLRLAVKFLDLRDHTTGGTDDNQDRVPFRKQKEAVGHAVRANYLYAGAADVFAETGDATLLDPLKKIWLNVVTRKMYVTGACGALYDGASPDGSKDQKQISRVHQAYGRDYQLPNSAAHNETCAAVGNALWNWRMLQITGDAKYADVVELVLYNALLAGVDLDGKRFFYKNTLRQLDTMPAALRWSRMREEWISCYCCPPNVARTIAQAHTYAYGRSDRGVWVHVFGASTLDTSLPDGRKVKLKQETAYPWDGRVKVTIEAAPAGEFSLFVRVPGWAEGATLRVNDESVDANRGRYAELPRVWKAGDVVELLLPMKPRFVESHPLVEESRNCVAAMRGPLVYCLESPDLPKGVRLLDVLMPRDAKLTTRLEKALLGEIAVIECKGEAATSQWGDQLYREYRPTEAKIIDLKMIPYYTWANRGKSEMTVWLPLGR